MHPLGTLSRRALVAAAAPASLGAAAEARQRQPPLAFVKAVILDVLPTESGTGFALTFDAWLEHADSALPRDLSGQTVVAAATSTAKARAFVATALRNKASIALEQAGFDVAPDRVAVVLI
jgi:hypothetical protein